MALTRKQKQAAARATALLHKMADNLNRRTEKRLRKKQISVDSTKSRQLKQRRRAIRSLQPPLVRYFRDQVEKAAETLASAAPNANTGKSASVPLEFDRRESLRDLIDTIAPRLAVVFGRAVYSEVASFAKSSYPDSTKFYGEIGRTGKFAPELVEKASTATEFIDAFEESPLERMIFNTPQGPVSLGFVTEYPEWMKAAIKGYLEDTFAEDFWSDIVESTVMDIEAFIRKGVIDGMSISDMARQMKDAFLGANEAYGKMRARRILRTEVGNALNGARTVAMQQLKEEIGAEFPMKRMWLSVLGTTTRDTHAHLDGVPEDSEGEWELGGVKARWPSDVRLPVGERANCQCLTPDMVISGVFTGSQRVWYDGTITEIVTNGTRLSVTPNHPIMTAKGLVAAGELKPGDKVMSYDIKVDRSSSGDNVEDKQPSAQEVFESMLLGDIATTSGAFVESTRTQVNDFYGDGEFCKGDVDIVRPDWVLLKNLETSIRKKSSDPVFVSVLVRLVREFCNSRLSFGFGGFGPASGRLPSSSAGLLSLLSPLLIGEIQPFGSLSLGSGSEFDVILYQSLVDHVVVQRGLFAEFENRDSRQIGLDNFELNSELFSSNLGHERGSVFSLVDSSLLQTQPERAVVNPQFIRESCRRFPREVSFDDVTEVRDFDYSGHVYDFQSEYGTILAGGRDGSRLIVTSNCTVTMAYGLDDSTAEEMISDYSKRILKKDCQALPVWEKVFCPTGPGGGRDPSCTPGGASKVSISDYREMSDYGEISDWMKGKFNWSTSKHEPGNAIDYLDMKKKDSETTEAMVAYRKSGGPEAKGWVNSALRGKEAWTPKTQTTRDLMDKFFETASMPESVVAFRGFSKSRFNNIKSAEPGSRFSDSGYVSTSLSQPDAKAFSGKGGGVVRVLVDKGSKAFAFNNSWPPGGGSEVLLNRDAVFEVVSSDDEGVTIRYVN